MAEFKTKVESAKEWVVEHKLRTVGCFWLGSVTGLMAYNWSRPMKTSVKIIHARVYAQALTLAALAGAAVAEYYDHKSGPHVDRRYAKYQFPIDAYSHKD
ncbi:hypothetical protein SLA2020_122820 [Shorea laevis]